MEKLTFCSTCGERNIHALKEGQIRYFCLHCNTIHYQNPKPTATLLCIKTNKILLGKRALPPKKGFWGLLGGFMELNETIEQAATRELKEESCLRGTINKIIGTCSHFNSIFGDILLIGIIMRIEKWENMTPGDDVSELQFFDIHNPPKMAFECHQKFINMYKKKEIK
tara:strand:+ start:614 stop:1117 length:504 start_codon:yes stop_codon:yes gene_type:complete